ncbi:MAG: AMP-binding protein [Sinomicrobium sp.]|nr:AMP-binding protein [Sinomicrobium sp.]
MKPTFDKIHLRFRLNGIHFNREELKEVAYSFIKEGAHHEHITGDFLLDWVNDKPYIHVNTSGSTGNPKRIRLLKQHMVNSALASGDFFGISVGDSALHCLPTNFIAGKMMLVRAMILGLEIDLVEPTANPMAETEKKYDFSAMTPFQAKNSLDHLDRIKKLIVGGAMVTKKLIKAFQHKQTHIYETYGMTETVTHIAAKQLNGFDDPGAASKAYFKILPHIKISQDKRNCLVIEAPEILETPIVTNDMVKLISDDGFEWIGRYDNVINSGGIKLIPEQIEGKLAAAIPNRFFVSGIPDEALGEKLILVVEGSDNDEMAMLKAIKALKTLQRFEIPKAIYFVNTFEETENGKIIREKSLEKIRI